MLGITEITFDVSFDNGKHWCSTEGLFPGTMHFGEVEESVKEWEVDSFEKLMELANDSYCSGVILQDKLFSWTPDSIRIRTSWDDSVVVRKFFFKPMMFRRIETEKHPSITWLAEHLSADNFMALAKEKEWNNIVLPVGK